MSAGQSSEKPKVFFGYPSRPQLLRETIANAATMLTDTGLVQVVKWEDLRVAGRLIISEIVSAIDDASVGAFVLTHLNHNVMFELGYAIGARRRVWLLMDDSHEPSRIAWEQIALRTTIGYAPYRNSEDIRKVFIRDNPQLREDTLFSQVVEPALQPAGRPVVFYVKSGHENEPERQLTRRVRRETDKGYRTVVSDPAESTYPFTWYAQQVYESAGVVVNLANVEQRDALTNNARGALVAGLAHGMHKPLLMLAHEDFPSPIDYRELLARYATARAAVSAASLWLDNTLPLAGSETPAPRVLSLATELRGVRLGEDVAENEEDELAEYFVETASYREVLERKTTIFVGRKGMGKTANLLRAAAELREDKRNLVVVIKPDGYEMEAVVRLLGRDMPVDVRSYLVDALWQYLLETEIALAALEDERGKPAGIATNSPAWALDRFCADPKLGINEDFAVRLERVVASLEGMNLSGDSVEGIRRSLVDVLYAGPIAELRSLLGDVLSDRARVAVLIDNLDRGWDRKADVAQLAELFLGLLVATRKLDRDFARPARGRRVHVTLGVFIRSDIFYHLKSVAREPDKLPSSALSWNDRGLLLRMAEQRYASVRGAEVDPAELWTAFFVPVVRGRPIPQYLLDRVLPRPRDFLHLCNAALRAAVNSGHSRVEEEDVALAEKAYSQFACDALRVENGVTVKELDEVLLEFLGSSARLTEDRVFELVGAAGIKIGRVGEVVDRLKALSFLGLEVSEDEFRYADDPEDAQKIDVLAARLAERRGSPSNYEIHPAFRPYLEVSGEDS